MRSECKVVHRSTEVWLDADMATAVARAVGGLMTRLLPELERLGAEREGGHVGFVGGDGVLRDLDGTPLLIVKLGVHLPTAEMIEEARRDRLRPVTP